MADTKKPQGPGMPGPLPAPAPPGAARAPAPAAPGKPQASPASQGADEETIRAFAEAAAQARANPAPQPHLQCLHCHDIFGGPFKDANPGRLVHFIDEAGRMFGAGEPDGEKGMNVSHGYCPPPKGCHDEHMMEIRREHAELRRRREQEQTPGQGQDQGDAGVSAQAQAQQTPGPRRRYGFKRRKQEGE